MPQQQYHFTDPKSPIKNLSPDKIEYVIEAYKSGRRITDIRNELPEIKSSKSFYNDLPYILTEEKCEHCDALVYYKPRRKGNQYIETKYCIACKHDYTENCSCSVCKEERAEEEKKIQEAFEKSWREFLEVNYSTKYSLEDLTIYDEINLALVLSRADLKNSIDFLIFKETTYKKRTYYGYETCIVPEHEFPLPIFPYAHQLINKNILIPSIHSDKKRIGFNTKDFSYEHIGIDDVYWEINLYDQDNKQLSAHDYLHHFVNNREFSNVEKSIFWREIYTAEVKAYIKHETYSIIKYKFKEHLFEEITDILIEDFPLSQAYYLIYCATRNTLVYENKYPVNQKKVTSFFRNNITSLSEKFIKKAKDFNRPNHLEVNHRSNFILNNILNQNGTKYFYLRTEDIVPNYIPNNLENSINELINN